jgi:hypothetical protein
VPEAVVVGVVVVKVVDIDVVAAIRFVELEIMPIIMLARAGNRGKKERGVRAISYALSCKVLLAWRYESYKGEVTGSARGAQEKEQGGMAWDTVRAEAKLGFGVGIVWGKRDEGVANGDSTAGGCQRIVRAGIYRGGNG